MCLRTWGVNRLLPREGQRRVGHRLVGLDASLDGIMAEAPSGTGGEQGSVAGTGSLLEPDAKNCRRGGCKGNAALLAALPGASQVGCATQLDVTAVEPGKLGESQAGRRCWCGSHGYLR